MALGDVLDPGGILAAAFAHAGAGLALVGPDGVLARVNAEWLRAAGVTAGGAVGRPVFEVLDGDREALAALLARARAGETVRAPRRARILDGHETWWDLTFAPVALAAGPGVLAAARDVTAEVWRERVDALGLAGGAEDGAAERRRSVVALAESERWLRESERVSRVGHYVFDIVPDRWTSSEVLDEIFGIDALFRRDTAGWLGLVHEEDRPAMATYLLEVLCRGRRFDREYRVVSRATGEVRWVHGLGDLLRDELGRVTRMFGTIQDVTKRRQAEQARAEAEEALRRSEQRFRTLIERSTDMLLLVDDEGRLQFLSPSVTEALGWPAEELPGRELLDLVHLDDQEGIATFLASLLSAPGGGARLTFRARHRDGSWRTLDATCRNLLLDAAVGAVVVNARDVTDRLRLEEQFRQAQKLESIGRLAGGVAHDFNNLLTVILSCSEGLRADLADAPATVKEDLDEIHQAGLRARDLTRQLLAFARKQVITPVRLDLATVVRSSQKLLRRVLGEDIALVVAAAPDPWTVLADPGQVEQILMNLAVNARDAMPKGGRLVISIRNVEVTPDQAAAAPDARAGQWVALVVQDNGAGMSPEVRSHLFEPFFTTKEHGRGTGLGLATVHGITAQAGGTIRVQSEPHAGTTFEILFPRAVPASAEEAPAAAPPARAVGGSDTVLVIEDDAHVRGITVRALRDAGYQVLVASNGGEALEVARRQRRLDLVVTDVVMPGLSGRAVVRELQRRQPALRALYVSGYTQDAIAQQGVLETGLQFLPKPFTASSLLCRVRAVLDSH